jgi:methylated-DNA-[protein]-cysteine S-methyltransferase
MKEEGMAVRAASPAENTGVAEKVETVSAPPLSLRLHWRGGRIVRLDLRRAETGELAADASPEARAVHAALARLAKGQAPDFPPLPLDWDSLPAFTRCVLETLYAQVPAGQTVTYGELAALSGQGGKARAVGQVMAKNPWPLIVPCHRVLGAGGGLTGYTNPHGLDLKALLLRLEGVPSKA